MTKLREKNQKRAHTPGSGVYASFFLLHFLLCLIHNKKIIVSVEMILRHSDERQMKEIALLKVDSVKVKMPMYHIQSMIILIPPTDVIEKFQNRMYSHRLFCVFIFVDKTCDA